MFITDQRLLIQQLNEASEIFLSEDVKKKSKILERLRNSLFADGEGDTNIPYADRKFILDTLTKYNLDKGDNLKNSRSIWVSLKKGFARIYTMMLMSGPWGVAINLAFNLCSSAMARQIQRLVTLDIPNKERDALKRDLKEIIGQMEKIKKAHPEKAKIVQNEINRLSHMYDKLDEYDKLQKQTPMPKERAKDLKHWD